MKHDQELCRMVATVMEQATADAARGKGPSLLRRARRHLAVSVMDAHDRQQVRTGLALLRDFLQHATGACEHQHEAQPIGFTGGNAPSTDTPQ